MCGVVWYPNLNKKYKNKLQVLQNKCILLCLELGNREHIGTEHFYKSNWPPIDQRFKQCFSTSVFKLFSEMCPQYMNEIYKQPIKTFFKTLPTTTNYSFNSKKFVKFRAFVLFGIVCQMMLNCQTM